ncbi:hypothetical protein ACFQAT_26665 [Undibacterium arcticum]|uniref:Ig-like domain-containing protein n=1 Tax=Undibacterium arcticum TaxID=1762892 RepID=A0ABV7EUD3_9BURK
MTINSGRLLGFALALAVVSPAGHAAPQVTPSGDGVPENLLRIELQLDTPLASPLDMHHVVLLDEAGAPIDDAFLDVPLHSRDGMRVSILMHPGRIKTGVGPNIALGMALHSGETVVLAIDDPQFPEPIRKTWVVGPALRQRIDLQRWAIRVPAAASREPLRIDFPAALDSSAAQMIAVAASDGRRLAGQVTLAKGETQWRFIPSLQWRAGTYELRVHPSLEDPQGNRLCSAFEQPGQSIKSCRDGGRITFAVP